MALLDNLKLKIDDFITTENTDLPEKTLALLNELIDTTNISLDPTIIAQALDAHVLRFLGYACFKNNLSTPALLNDFPLPTTSNNPLQNSINALFDAFKSASDEKKFKLQQQFHEGLVIADRTLPRDLLHSSNPAKSFKFFKALDKNSIVDSDSLRVPFLTESESEQNLIMMHLVIHSDNFIIKTWYRNANEKNKNSQKIQGWSIRYAAVSTRRKVNLFLDTLSIDISDTDKPLGLNSDQVEKLHEFLPHDIVNGSMTIDVFLQTNEDDFIVRDAYRKQLPIAIKLLILGVQNKDIENLLSTALKRHSSLRHLISIYITFHIKNPHICRIGLSALLNDAETILNTKHINHLCLAFNASPKTALFSSVSSANEGARKKIKDKTVPLVEQACWTDMMQRAARGNENQDILLTENWSMPVLSSAFQNLKVLYYNYAHCHDSLENFVKECIAFLNKHKNLPTHQIAKEQILQLLKTYTITDSNNHSITGLAFLISLPTPYSEHLTVEKFNQLIENFSLDDQRILKLQYLIGERVRNDFSTYYYRTMPYSPSDSDLLFNFSPQSFEQKSSLENSTYWENPLYRNAMLRMVAEIIVKIPNEKCLGYISNILTQENHPIAILLKSCEKEGAIYLNSWIYRCAMDLQANFIQKEISLTDDNIINHINTLLPKEFTFSHTPLEESSTFRLPSNHTIKVFILNRPDLIGESEKKLNDKIQKAFSYCNKKAIKICKKIEVRDSATGFISEKTIYISFKRAFVEYLLNSDNFNSKSMQLICLRNLQNSAHPLEKLFEETRNIFHDKNSGSRAGVSEKIASITQEVIINEYVDAHKSEFSTIIQAMLSKPLADTHIINTESSYVNMNNKNDVDKNTIQETDIIEETSEIVDNSSAHKNTDDNKQESDAIIHLMTSENEAKSDETTAKISSVRRSISYFGNSLRPSMDQHNIPRPSYDKNNKNNTFQPAIPAVPTVVTPTAVSCYGNTGYDDL